MSAIQDNLSNATLTNVFFWNDANVEIVKTEMFVNQARNHRLVLHKIG